MDDDTEPQQFEQRQMILKVGGESFRCECGCNVFTNYAESKYRCNGCAATYTSEDE